MDSIINTVSSYFKAVEYPQLSGQHVGTFCYDSIKDRHPVTITKLIDQTFKIGSRTPELERDTKDVTAILSRLKNRLQTDKELELLEGKEDDIEMWNNAVKLLKPGANTWFTAPWLFIECYMYRAIHQAFQQTTAMRYPEYDYFGKEKDQGLEDSLSNMSRIASLLLHPSPSQTPAKLLTEFVQLCLWGNRADLSILKHFGLELSDVTQGPGDGDAVTLSNHLERVVKYLLELEGGRVDIVLDNSGYELFGDMCLAEVLLRTTKLTSVRLHMKCIPWFRSDVTDSDVKHLLTAFKGSEDPSLKELGSLWQSRFHDNKFTRTDHPFWTSPHGFCEMSRVSPELYDELSQSSFLFFKGDLNYRKLVNDRQWPYDTDFVTALEGFNPAKLCALRTIKSDSIVDCESSRVENILESDREKLFCGHYALISSNIS